MESAALNFDELFKQAKADFVTWLVNLALGSILLAAPGLSWFSWGIKGILQLVFTWLVGKGELGLFILNAKILTSEQAKDYRETVAKRLLAPNDIPDIEWEKLEREANEKMVELIRFSA